MLYAGPRAGVLGGNRQIGGGHMQRTRQKNGLERTSKNGLVRTSKNGLVRTSKNCLVRTSENRLVRTSENRLDEPLV
eukprot:COSAG02_NODE_10244_length_1988_cov_1.307570_2_plen_77_part_00